MLSGLPLLYFEIVLYLTLFLLASYGLKQETQAARTVVAFYSITMCLAVYGLFSFLLHSQAILVFSSSARLRAIPSHMVKLTPWNQATKKQLQRAGAQEEHKIRAIEAEHQLKILFLEKGIRRLKSRIAPDREDRKDSVHGTRTFSWFLHDHDMEYPLVVTAISHIRPSLDKTCSICFADFKYGDRVAELPCNHGSHEGCVDLWLKRRFACPLCQQELL